MKFLPHIVLTACIAVFAACGHDNYATFSGFQQGTTYTVIVKNPANGLDERIDEVFDMMDNTFSMFNPQSLVSRINRNETDATTPLFDECFAIVKKVHAHTDGFYDPTVKPLVDLWGFGPGQQQVMPQTDSVMEYVGLDKIRIRDGCVTKDDPRVQLDFSSVAKGITVDKIALMLDGEGMTDYMIEIGGEVRVKGVNAAGNKWRIGINNPVGDFSRQYEAIASFGGTLNSIATSGNYRNWFTDEAGRVRVHTIDPKTGAPAMGNVLSVSIAAADCGTADAYATGLMAAHDMETVRRMLPIDGVEYLIMFSNADGEVEKIWSPAFPLVKE